ncbi:phage tail assembly chaperone [Breoghania sp.]|uniref:phage tail assembly chaperone n=1 Tax=Breoghania sp. TaxID=2065378 RepID=UPI0029CA936B|nr:phage tail assembly chaperone [Breoghania sp.]
MEPFPWAEVLHFCLNHLRWPPQTVWAATPREVAAALTSAPATHKGSKPARGGLEALLRRYPDRPASA